MQIRVPTNFEGREFDKSLKLLKSTPKMGQFLGHFCLQSENESQTGRRTLDRLVDKAYRLYLEKEWSRNKKTGSIQIL